MALERLKRAVAHAAPLTRLLFGVKVPHPTEQGHWDFSTLVLFDELKRRVKPGARVLELGTGEVGTLTVAMARLTPAAYLALDIAEEAVVSARRVAKANAVEAEFLQSDLLTSVSPTRSFDLTFFNPPYVPLSLSARWRPMGEPARVWDGGEDGLEVIRRFWLAAGQRGSNLGVVLLGFNRNSVAPMQIEALAREQGFLQAGLTRAWHPGTVAAFVSELGGRKCSAPHGPRPGFAL